MGADNSKMQTKTPPGSYYYNSTGRQMYPGNSFELTQKMPATPRTQQEWLQANAQARLAAQPRAGPYSQLDQPVVSSLDPHAMTQNPLDSYQDNIYYLLSVYRNRNSNHDPRGQPALPSNWEQGQDQLVQIRNTARLDRHGASTQITGCSKAKAPVY